MNLRDSLLIPMLFDTTGKRLYNSETISRAKGRAKSELAAFLVLFEFLGPCRFDGWARGGEIFRIGDFQYEYEPGEAMGRPITSPFIRLLATEESQVGNTYSTVYYILGGNGEGSGSQPLLDAYEIPASNVMLGGIIHPDGGEIRPSTASAAAKDGGKESFAVADEVHLYNTPELHRMYNTVVRNMDKRLLADPWMLSTTTMYAPGENSVGELAHDEARRIVEGTAKIDNLLFDHRQADPDVNVADIDSIIAGLTEAYGPAAEWMPITRIAKAFFDRRRAIADQRRYFLNQPTSTSDAWLTAYEIESVAAEEIVAPGEKIALGFDGSRKRANGGIADSTVLVGCRISDAFLFPLGVWEQPEGPIGENWVVPSEEVDAAVDHARKTYDVVAFFADPPYWESTIAAWEAEFGDDLAISAGPKSAIAWWTNRTTLMSRALDTFYTTVIDRGLKILKDSVLIRHLLNARRRPRREGMAVGKEHPSSRNKIDGAIAAVLALLARNEYLAAGPKDKKKRRAFQAMVVRRY